MDEAGYKVVDITDINRSPKYGVLWLCELAFLRNDSTLFDTVNVLRVSLSSGPASVGVVTTVWVPQLVKRTRWPHGCLERLRTNSDALWGGHSRL